MEDRPLASKAEAEHGEGSVSVIASQYTVPCTAMGFMFTQWRGVDHGTFAVVELYKDNN